MNYIIDYVQVMGEPDSNIAEYAKDVLYLVNFLLIDNK